MVQKVVKDKIKVIKIGDLLALPEVDPNLSIVEKYALCLKKIYTENKVIAQVEIKGEKLFVCEV